MIFAERARPRPQEDITPEPEHGEDGDLNVEDTITQEREDDDHDDGDDDSEDVSDSDEEEDSLATTSQSDQANTASSSGNTFQVNAQIHISRYIQGGPKKSVFSKNENRP